MCCSSCTVIAAFDPPQARSKHSHPAVPTQLNSAHQQPGPTQNFCSRCKESLHTQFITVHMQLSHAATVFNPTSRSLDQSTNLPSADGPQPKPELEAIHTAHAAPTAPSTAVRVHSGHSEQDFTCSGRTAPSRPSVTTRLETLLCNVMQLSSRIHRSPARTTAVRQTSQSCTAPQAPAAQHTEHPGQQLDHEPSPGHHMMQCSPSTACGVHPLQQLRMLQVQPQPCLLQCQLVLGGFPPSPPLPAHGQPSYAVVRNSTCTCTAPQQMKFQIGVCSHSIPPQHSVGPAAWYTPLSLMRPPLIVIF